MRSTLGSVLWRFWHWKISYRRAENALNRANILSPLMTPISTALLLPSLDIIIALRMNQLSPVVIWITIWCSWSKWFHWTLGQIMAIALAPFRYVDSKTLRASQTWPNVATNSSLSSRQSLSDIVHKFHIRSESSLRLRLNLLNHALYVIIMIIEVEYTECRGGQGTDRGWVISSTKTFD